MYSLPKQWCDVVLAAFGVVWEGFGLHSYFAPHLLCGCEDCNGCLHVGVLEYGAHAGAIVVKQAEIWPPGVLFVEVAAVLHPSGEARLRWRVVESVPHGVGDSADGTHVAAQFEEFEGGLEHAVGVGHLLGAD